MGEQVLRDALLYPASVALIGASATEGRLTARPQTFLQRHRWRGRLYPVNPNRDTTFGLPCFASIDAIPEAVDHAYILLDADPAIAALHDCARVGVRVVSMLADGFAEAGAEGAARQERLVEVAERYGIAVIGPNSTGVVETRTGFACTTNAAFAAGSLLGGRFAVLSQSGSMIGAMLSRASAVGLGFSSYVSVGNEACLGVGEIGELLVEDPRIDGFALFLETIRRPEAVARFAARAAAAQKPIIAYLIGKSAAGKALASSHTGAIASRGRAISAFLDACDILEVHSFEALFETAHALSLRLRMRDRPSTATVVTTTGGGGGMVYDLLGLRNVPLAPASAAAMTELAQMGLALKAGPIVDVTLAGTKYDVMKRVISTLIADASTGVVVAVIGSSAQFSPELAVTPIVDAVLEIGASAAPVFAMPVPFAPDAIVRFNAAGVPAFRTGDSCAEAVEMLLRKPSENDNAERPRACSAADLIMSHPRGAFTEVEAASIVRALNIPTPANLVVRSAEDLPVVLPFDGPYVVKVISRQIMHKTEAGGVVVGLTDREAIADAIFKVTRSVAAQLPNAEIEGFLLQKMERGIGEVIVGLVRDSAVGPMISVGAGGIFTEIYRDVCLRPAPISVGAARRMLESVRGLAPLRGFRGAPTGDLIALAEAVSRFSTLALLPYVVEAEMNPVLVRPAGEGIVALDALVRVAASGKELS